MSDTGANETYAWITLLQQEDKIAITMPILVAPRLSTSLVMTYNPRGLTPYYCLLDAKGIVQSRGPVGMGDWPTLEHEWQSTSGSKRLSRLNQYW
ncbi:hypothetical protein [Ktedonobacter sp. SOSP1-52]|uniref:hypothetical protein n=1 Tax=Ktedonobacter sp. SOSP1-52 TaxID=2778366 RepID=UPI001F274938|nr:hypothetical protein [Ktedonobacter sp. SOSP1-52]